MCRVVEQGLRGRHGPGQEEPPQHLAVRRHHRRRRQGVRHRQINRRRLGERAVGPTGTEDFFIFTDKRVLMPSVVDPHHT